MKAKFLLIAIIFHSLKSFSQNYIPMNLDTSCYWVHDYRYYYGFPYTDCHAEYVTEVFGDTTINSLKYHKLRTYLTEITSMNTMNCYFYFNVGYTYNYIREDSSTKRIYKISGFGNDTLFYDYNIVIGDSVDLGLTYLNPVVDSINYVIVNGITRKHIWCGINFNGSAVKLTLIEGLGSIENFPSGGYSEWMMNRFTMRCFTKNGIVIFGDTSQPCFKKPMLTNLLNPTKDIFKNNFTLNYSNNSFQINNPNNEKLKIVLLDLMGNKIISETTNSIYYQSKISNSISTGIYILQVGNEKGNIVKKIIVE